MHVYAYGCMSMCIISLKQILIVVASVLLCMCVCICMCYLLVGISIISVKSLFRYTDTWCGSFAPFLKMLRVPCRNVYAIVRYQLSSIRQPLESCESNMLNCYSNRLAALTVKSCAKIPSNLLDHFYKQLYFILRLKFLKANENLCHSKR